MAQTASPLSTGATGHVAGTRPTRPETIGWFVGNLALCLLVPVLVIWFAPRYTMRREYGRAFACVAIAVAWFLFLVFVLGAA